MKLWLCLLLVGLAFCAGFGARHMMSHSYCVTLDDPTFGQMIYCSKTPMPTNNMKGD